MAEGDLVAGQPDQPGIDGGLDVGLVDRAPSRDGRSGAQLAEAAASIGGDHEQQRLGPGRELGQPGGEGLPEQVTDGQPLRQRFVRPQRRGQLGQRQRIAGRVGEQPAANLVRQLRRDPVEQRPGRVRVQRADGEAGNSRPLERIVRAVPP